MFGRLRNWLIKLSEFNIDYIPQTTIKGQALANFVAEMVNPLTMYSPSLSTIYIDGLSCHSSWGVEVYIVSNYGKEVYYSIRLEFKTTDNEAKYKTLLVGLTIVNTLGAT